MSDPHNLPILTQHRPVRLPGRQPHLECAHPTSSLSADGVPTLGSPTDPADITDPGFEQQRSAIVDQARAIVARAIP